MNTFINEKVFTKRDDIYDILKQLKFIFKKGVLMGFFMYLSVS